MQFFKTIYFLYQFCDRANAIIFAAALIKLIIKFFNFFRPVGQILTESMIGDEQTFFSLQLLKCFFYFIQCMWSRLEWKQKNIRI
ncbi:hypothetical protein GQ37_022685 [Janthinobacterium sp. BJB1]|nr:hypothetical protein GQ37_022685 [Janthinobacterium sp. BJB1]